MKIIYEQDDELNILHPSDAFLETLTGTEEEKLIHIANKDLPTGTKYEIVEDSVIPTDRTFRGAWEYTSGDDEKTSADLSLDDQLKYNQITQEEYDANNN